MGSPTAALTVDELQNSLMICWADIAQHAPEYFRSPVKDREDDGHHHHHHNAGDEVEARHSSGADHDCPHDSVDVASPPLVDVATLQMQADQLSEERLALRAQVIKLRDEATREEALNVYRTRLASFEESTVNTPSEAEGANTRGLTFAPPTPGLDYPSIRSVAVTEPIAEEPEVVGDADQDEYARGNRRLALQDPVPETSNCDEPVGEPVLAVAPSDVTGVEQQARALEDNLRRANMPLEATQLRAAAARLLATHHVMEVTREEQKMRGSATGGEELDMLKAMAGHAADEIAQVADQIAHRGLPAEAAMARALVEGISETLR